MKSRKKAPRAAFVITVSVAAAAGALNACGGTVEGVPGASSGTPTTNPPPPTPYPSNPPGPIPPRPPDAKLPKATFAVTKLHLGESDRAGVKSPNAWQAFGRNVDGLVTNVTSASSPNLATVCKRRSGAPSTIHNDGSSGVDNNWGKEVLKLIDPFNPNPSKAANDEIAKGGRTAMIAIDGTGGFFAYAEAIPTTPTWNASEVRPIASDWMNGKAPRSTIAAGSILADGTYESGLLSGTTRIVLGSSTPSVPAFVVELRRGVVRMKLSADGSTATDGIISGVISSDELVTEIGKVAGRFSTDLCQGSTMQAISDSIRLSSDILLDGSQDPTKECDGLSIGIGFEATRVEQGAVAPALPPPPDPCL